LPTLGAKRLRSLRPADLRSLYAGLRGRDKPLSPRTIQAAHRVASMMLVFAVDDGYIATNPAAGRDVAPKARATADERDAVWDAAQIKSFLDAAADDRLFALWRLATTTGMRRGELLALRWADLDLSAGRAQIVRSFILGPDHKVRYTSPKTARSRRTIDLDTETVKALKSHRKLQTEERLAALGAWPDEGEDADLVFTDEVGRPLFPRSVTMRFAELVAEAGLPKIRLHDLRHSAATLMLRAGVPVHVVSEHLGHASASITMDVYAHVLRDQRTDATAKLAAAIDGT
jgi:integrase